MKTLNTPKTLRIITIAVLIHAVLVVFSQVILLISNLYNRNENPIIPDHLHDYMVFPIYFLLPLFLAIAIYASRSLLKKQFHFKVILALAIFSVAYFAFGGELYAFIQSFHSSAS